MSHVRRPFIRNFPAVPFRHEFDRLFGDFLNQWGGFEQRLPVSPGYPSLNVWEDGEAIVVEAEVPGLKSDDLDIAVVANQLTIKGRRETVAASRTGAYHRRERGTGEFVRELTLPAEVDAENVQASLVDGVLQVRLPKSAAAKPRRIPVVRS